MTKSCTYLKPASRGQVRKNDEKREFLKSSNVEILRCQKRSMEINRDMNSQEIGHKFPVVWERWSLAISSEKVASIILYLCPGPRGLGFHRHLAALASLLREKEAPKPKRHRRNWVKRQWNDKFIELFVNSTSQTSELWIYCERKHWGWAHQRLGTLGSRSWQGTELMLQHVSAVQHTTRIMSMNRCQRCELCERCSHDVHTMFTFQSAEDANVCSFLKALGAGVDPLSFAVGVTGFPTTIVLLLV